MGKQKTTAVVDDEDTIPSETEGGETVPADKETSPVLPAAAPADPEVARVAEALALPTRKRRAGGGETAEYVVDPSGKHGELHRDGVVYKPGDPVMLPADVAEELGDLVVKSK